MSEPTIIFNYFPKVIAGLKGETLEKALMAGGQVVEGAAKVNVEKTFSSKSMGGAGLGGSIHTVVVSRGSNSCLVHVGPSVIYGRIQELGGVIKPVTAKMLSWVNAEGERIFANMVHIPARPYLRPALDENIDKVNQAIAFQIKKGVEANLTV
jgi:hypothetical protein